MFFGPVLLKNKNELFFTYYENIRNNDLYIKNSVSNNSKILELSKEINMIEKEIKGNNNLEWKNHSFFNKKYDILIIYNRV